MESARWFLIPGWNGFSGPSLSPRKIENESLGSPNDLLLFHVFRVFCSSSAPAGDYETRGKRGNFPTLEGARAWLGHRDPPGTSDRGWRGFRG